MTEKQRRLMKHEMEDAIPLRQPPAPPLSDGPDLSETLRLLERISRMPDIRFEKVHQMQELIARGEFETEERINGTIKRLMEELGL